MGAEVLARIVRGWLKDRPNETLVQLDLSNAYGSVHRHFALRAVNTQLPEMSPMLAAKWARGRTHAWVQSDEGWEQLAVNRGAWQGAPHSNVAFCCALKAATSKSKLAWEKEIVGGQYADDCFYHGPAGTVADNWEDLKEKLKEAGLELQDKKSAAYTPNTEIMSDDERKGLCRMLAIVPRADHPPRVLGTIAQNQHWAMTEDFDEKDDEEADPATLAIKRAEAAKKLCEAIKELSVADVEGPSIAAGWAILSKSAARALDFDARLTPSGTIQKAQEILKTALRETTETLVDIHLSDEEHNIVSAPGPLGGCSLRALSNIIADAAFLSSWISTRKAVQEHANAMGRPLMHEPDSDEAENAKVNLQQAGVIVDINGKIELSEDAKQIIDQAQWILKDDEEAKNPAEQAHGPAQRTLSRIMRSIAQIEAAKRWAHSDEKEKERRPEAGGPGTRGTWSAPPDGTLLPNAHWRAATQARIGCINIPQNIKCRLKTNAGLPCETTIDQGGIHSQLCKMGPARMRPHRAVQTTLGGLLPNTGAHVDLERAIPELFTWQGQKCTEAILDAAIRWPTSLHTTVVDVTVRCPHASRYGGGVTASPTEAAEDEKHKRYGPRVTPIALSTYGRLGREGRNAFEALAAEARWNTDDPSNQKCQVAKWRKTLEQSLLHTQADVLLLSLGAEGCIGWQKHAGTRLGRQRTAAAHTHKLTDEQIATIKANRILAEARREALRAMSEQGVTAATAAAAATAAEVAAEAGAAIAMNNMHELVAEDHAEREEPNSYADEEFEDLFCFPTNDLDKDLNATPSTTELCFPSVPPREHNPVSCCIATSSSTTRVLLPLSAD